MTDFDYEAIVGRILSRNRWGNERKLAEALGISPNTWTAYKKGTRSFGLNEVTKICDILGISAHWLLYGSEAATPPRQSSVGSNGNTVFIPHFEIRAAAGAGALVVSENVSSYFAAEREWLRRMLPSWAAPNAVVGILEGSGDSMEPTIRDGDLVMAVKDPPEFAVDRGGVFLLLHHGHLRIKRLHVDMRSGDITLISDNQRYPPEIVPRDRQEYDLQVLAQIFFAGGRLRS